MNISPFTEPDMRVMKIEECDLEESSNERQLHCFFFFFSWQGELAINFFFITIAVCLAMLGKIINEKLIHSCRV